MSESRDETFADPSGVIELTPHAHGCHEMRLPLEPRLDSREALSRDHATLRDCCARNPRGPGTAHVRAASGPTPDREAELGSVHRAPGAARVRAW